VSAKPLKIFEKSVGNDWTFLLCETSYLWNISGGRIPAPGHS